TDAYVVKLDAKHGDVLFARDFSSSNGAVSFAARFDRDDRIVLVGVFSGTVDLGDHPRSAGPGGTLFALALAP
ncbi:MAG TPA: hypothetical protein VHB21_00500, partial [Minicystis sp.]|nr:hypothetical protein [Minicystis sp.]